MTLNETRLKEAYLDYKTDPPAGITPEQAALVREQHTAMRLPWLSPDDMAPIVVFLGSDEARRISGASFDVDAGDSAQFTA
jgi:NAD(P)-dependent dehydrogenase (short-subunit alcohol dehydrogenase family)